MSVTKEKMARYKATARRRWEQERKQLSQRFHETSKLAREAAELLREQFGVERVVLFGSAGHEGLFHSKSDMDLAVWGLDEREYYRAVAQLIALDPQMDVDLIRVEDAGEPLRKEIEISGVPL